MPTFTHSRKTTQNIKTDFIMEKKKFVIKFAVWTAVIVALVLLVLGLGWGKVIEETLFGEVTKWIFVGIGVISIFEGFVFSTIAPLVWHQKQKKGKNETGKVD